MKRPLILFLLLCLCLTMFACEKKNKNGGTDPVTEAPTETPTDRPTEQPSDPVTDEPTDPVTDEPSDPVTDEPTDPVTDEPTDPVADPLFSACDASQAVAATRLITVTYGAELLAREEIDYDLTAGTYTGERQVRGSADADETFSVEPLSGAVSDPFGALAFRRADFTDADEQDGRFSGTIARARLAEALGLSADGLPETARLTLTIEADRLTSLSLTYTSDDGNTVGIAYTFAY